MAVNTPAWRSAREAPTARMAIRSASPGWRSIAMRCTPSDRRAEMPASRASADVAAARGDDADAWPRGGLALRQVQDVAEQARRPGRAARAESCSGAGRGGMAIEDLAGLPAPPLPTCAMRLTNHDSGGGDEWASGNEALTTTDNHIERSWRRSEARQRTNYRPAAPRGKSCGADPTDWRWSGAFDAEPNLGTIARAIVAQQASHHRADACRRGRRLHCRQPDDAALQVRRPGSSSRAGRTSSCAPTPRSA